MESPAQPSPAEAISFLPLSPQPALTLLPKGPCATKVAYALQMLQCFPLHRSS